MIDAGNHRRPAQYVLAAQHGNLVDDDAGFREFFQSCWPRVRKFVEVRTDDDRFVDDVVQEAMLQARANWQRIRHYDRPEKWVMTVAVHRARRLEAMERHRKFILSTSARNSEQSAGVVPDLATQSTEHHALYAAIRQLPTRRAETIIMHMLGYGIKETAEILGINPGSVKTHLCLGRRDLKRILSRDLKRILNGPGGRW